MRAARVSLGILVAIALSFGVWWFSSYDAKEFRGAAPMRDTGVFSYYRYHAPLGEVPFAVAGNYTLRFSGLPSEHMGLQLYLPGGTTKDRDLLESLTTYLRIEIADSHGNVVCSGGGTPSAKDYASGWVLMSSIYEAAFWHQACRDVAFARHTEYTLQVTVRDVDPRTPHVSLKAILEGGGIELS